MRRIIITLAATIIAVLAYANIAAACGSWSYQPEVPRKLLK